MRWRSSITIVYACAELLVTLDDKPGADSEYHGVSKGAQEVRKSNRSMTIWFRSIIDVSEVMALDSGAGSVHEGQGQFSAAAFCVIID